ncbi:hypothetical protein LCGC14_0265440 [marine sediment metagenome]|uniref:General secretion pathway GspH domain-containing protein n=1 Tax=marine sediment metagenome TaxID=412755 RepID=A0A0F9U541_9ZZZZ|nr:GspH/FimT family pseudopilin [Halomonas sp.]HDZ49469.1 prepilin-type N-terminal cleavage/methylation domain-containing protein [Halomonas sp.]HEB03079.1 prepilin-type N-terminal cleavage/methylation domain-containing protein [Halomonas sp.]
MLVGKQQRGFTLIELLVTLMIVTIIAIMAVPAFGGFLARQQLSSDVNEMISVLSFARSEAIKQRQPITVQFSPADECREGGQMNAGSDSARWCYWVESKGETMRMGPSANITTPEQAFSLTFQSLGDAEIDGCSSNPCRITISPQREQSNIPSITLAINITGSIRRQDSAP